MTFTNVQEEQGAEDEFDSKLWCRFGRRRGWGSGTIREIIFMDPRTQAGLHSSLQEHPEKQTRFSLGARPLGHTRNAVEWCPRPFDPVDQNISRKDQISIPDHALLQIKS